VFQAAVDGNGINPLRLAPSPRLMPLHADAPVDTVTVIGAEPDLVESCVEVAVIVAVSAPEFGGVKTTPVPEATPVAALNVPPMWGSLKGSQYLQMLRARDGRRTSGGLVVRDGRRSAHK